MRKQFEVDNLQHTLDIEKGALDQKKKVSVREIVDLLPSPVIHYLFQRYEDGMKLQQMEKHALEKRLMDLQQELQRESIVEKEHATFMKQ